MRSLFPRVSIMVAVISVLTCQVLLAQAYPTKPIQLINTSAEGGAGAFVARLMAEKLVPVLGQPVTVENRPGASGITATREVARAAPDGYTVLIGHTAELAILPHFVRNLGYDPQKDLQPVSLIAVFPLALVVKSSVQQSRAKGIPGAVPRHASRAVICIVRPGDSRPSCGRAFAAANRRPAVPCPL